MNQKLIWNSRPKDRSKALTKSFEDAGFSVLEAPLISIRSIEINRKDVNFTNYEYLLLSSPRSFSQIWESFSDYEIENLPHKIFAVGKSCVENIQDPFEIKLIGPGQGRNELAKQLANSKMEKGRILHFCSAQTKLNPEKFKKISGFEVKNIPIYESYVSAETIELLEKNQKLLQDIWAVLIFSSSAAEALKQCSDMVKKSLQKKRIVASGLETYKTLQNENWNQITQLPETSVDSITKEFIKYLSEETNE